MKVLGFDNVFVPVGDCARAVEFYRDVLDFGKPELGRGAARGETTA